MWPPYAICHLSPKIIRVGVETICSACAKKNQSALHPSVVGYSMFCFLKSEFYNQIFGGVLISGGLNHIFKCIIKFIL